MKKKPVSPRLRKLARASAWALLAAVIVLMLSGWGITQTGIIFDISFGLIDRRTANSIHQAANIPLVFFFLTHVLINIRIAISRKSSSLEWLINGVLILIGALVMALTVYLEYFRLGG